MSELLRPDHPIQKLLFFTLQVIDDALRLKLEDSIEELAESRAWVLEAPQVVTVDEDWQKVSRADTPFQGTGVILPIYSGHPPNVVPPDVDRRQLDEVTDLVKQLCAFSQANDIAFEGELDQEFVGTINRGKMDRSLAEMFLGEWRRHLGS
jgi:hypothetical protein